MSKRYHDLLATAVREDRKFASEQDVSDYLDAQGVHDPTERIAFKISMAAAGELGTDQPQAFDLATDRAVYRPQVAPLGREIAVLLRRAGLSVDRSYSQADITEALNRSDLALEEKMAIRIELGDRGLMRAAGEITPTPRPGMTATRSMQASTPPAKGTKLLNPDGSARTLTFLP